MAQTFDFGLGKFKLKRFDGKGEVFEVFRTAAALMDAKEDGIDDLELMSYDVAVRSAESQGVLKELGLDVPSRATPRDKAHALASVYACIFVPTDDDGNELLPEGTGEEPDPT